ncbi:MAG: PspC domain-containing protein [Balneolaceae bacterium]|nr:PspC domain-containing protein [Balneolaceae bacterium]
MAEQSKQKTKSQTGTASLEFDEFDLNTTMQDFLKEEEKDTGKGIWNVATISGMVMLFLSLTFLIQWIGIPVGEGLGEFVRNSVDVLPIVGGILVTLIGFGFFVGDRKKERKRKKAKKKRRKAKQQYSDIHGAEISGAKKPSSTSRLSNDLDSDFGSSSGAKSSNMDFDAYGYRHAKKLMKSRSNKKLAGVCGGLAKYFGISSTVVRFIFVAAFFMGYGASLLVYLGLAIAMPKEPVEFMDDFDF